mgnify:CR=1 FL=1
MAFDYWVTRHMQVGSDYPRSQRLTVCLQKLWKS